MFSTSITKTGPSLKAVAKQLNFATATALTQTAKDGQAASISAVHENFTLRSDWADPKNKMGVRIKPAARRSKRRIRSMI